MNEDFLDSMVKETPDTRLKSIFHLKPVVAQLLKFLVPYFRDMPVDGIIDRCLTDPDRPESPFVTLLSESRKLPFNPQFYRDLSFRLKLPFPLRLNGLEAANVLAGVEPQTQKPDYPLIVRAELYNWEAGLCENITLDLKTEKSMYTSLWPVWTIWINYFPLDGKSAVQVETLAGNRMVSNGESWEYNSIDPYRTMSLVIMVNIGDDVDLSEKSVYSFCYVLGNGTTEEIVRLFESYGFMKIGKTKVRTLMLAFERTAFKEGELSGEQAIQKRNVINLANYLQRNDSGLTQDQALKKAEEILDPKANEPATFE